MFENLRQKLGEKLLNVKSVGFYSKKEVQDLFNSSFDEEANLTNYLLKGYGENPFVNQVINRIAKTVARLPLTSNSQEALTLLEKPNDNMFQNDFFEALLTSLLSTGNAFGYSEGYYGIGVPTEVKVLSVIYLDPYFDGDGNFIYAIYDNGNGRQTKILPTELLHIKFANILDQDEEAWFGLSPLRALQKTYTASNEVINAQNHLFKNKGAIGFVSSSEATMPLTPKARKSIDEQFTRKTGGSGQYGKVLTSDVPMSYTEIGKTPKDLMLDTASISFLRVICSSFGVDSALFNDPQNKTYNNRLEATRDYYNDVCIPLMERILQAFNYTWKVDIEVNKDEILAIQKDDEKTGVQPKE